MSSASAGSPAFAGQPARQASLPDYYDLARGTRAFDAIIAEGCMPLSFRAIDRAEQVWGLLVSTNYFDTLRVRPRIGRLFSEADLAATEVPAGCFFTARSRRADRTRPLRPAERRAITAGADGADRADF